ncbi:hypothetical protein L5515_002375 [Caenorhabditis briggsae]|uniref:Transcription factor AP-2 C-terminal domain-containing protein n=1 Tax=Caenorhabditis briggsae TaxID=6238 RepID=A0AAE9E612_CAEBR|nr:hypothetical protein L5515_002375 [Caenorhabditis briggsae]
MLPHIIQLLAIEHAKNESKTEENESENTENQTAAPEVPKGFETETIKDKDVFEEVFGKLSNHLDPILYKVTTEEMRRRLFGQEHFNSSSLALNLRRAKSRAGGEILRRELEQKGISLNVNHRKMETPKLVCSLVEGEVIHMAKDMEDIVDEQYDCDLIAQEVVDEMKENEKLDFEGFETCMSSLSTVFSSVVPPLSGMSSKSSENRKFNHQMEAFSNVTHGFGIVSQPTWIRQMTKIGEKMEEIVKEN